MEFSGERALPSEVVSSREEIFDAAITAHDAYLFPISYLGFGVKISKFGLDNPRSSVGALFVFWAAQTTVEKIMVGIEALNP